MFLNQCNKSNCKFNTPKKIFKVLNYFISNKFEKKKVGGGVVVFTAVTDKRPDPFQETRIMQIRQN